MKYTIPAVTLLAVVLFVGSIYSADAAVDMFLKIDTIEGESQSQTHQNEIDVLAWSWGASQSGSFHVGGGGGAGKANFQDVSITKYVDKSTPKLLQAVATGQHFQKVDLYTDRSGEKASPYIRVNMEKVLVTSISMGGSGGEDRLTENISLNFAKFKYEYTEQNEKGGAGTTHPFSWNIETNSP